MSNNEKQNLTIVMFGATGDLAKKKLWSSFETLVEKKKINKPDIVGVAYSDRTQQQFKDLLHESSSENWYQSATYLSGDLDKKPIYNDISETLQGKTDQVVMFVLAVAPEYFMDVAIGLDSSGLLEKCREHNHQIRILIEKPFGTDLESAKKLDQEFCARYQSNEIYRIDHYLGKSMLQNLYTLRAANPWFSAGLDNRTVDSIEVKFLENNDASDRGAFYDMTGAWRDVGQNHLLQLLSSAISPVNFQLNDDKQSPNPDRNLAISSLEPIESKSWQRGQYQSYQQTNKVADDSETETYFKVYLQSDLENWQNVDITLESGKSTGKDIVSITYNLKSPADKARLPKLVFSSKPTEKALIELWGQDESHGDQLEIQKFEFSYCNPNTDAYERVFLAAIKGETQWFVSSDEIKAQWQLSDKVSSLLQQQDLICYPDHSLPTNLNSDESI